MDEVVARALVDDAVELIIRVSRATERMRERLAPASEEEQRPYVLDHGRAARALWDLINRICEIHPGLKPTQEDFLRVEAERVDAK